MKIINFQVDGNELFNKFVWLIIVSILGFSAKKFNEMANDIKDLNKTMIVVVAGQTNDRKTLDDHELRLRVLEKSSTHAPLPGGR